MPAAIAGVVLVLLGLVALIPGDVERRLAEFSQGYRGARFAKRLASGPATLATGVRTAIAYVRHPQARLRSRWSARSGSGPRTSGSSGRASRRTAPTSRSA